MIVVVDYGMGNLRSVSKALEVLGARVKVSCEPKDIRLADKVVLPGVGAFGDAAAELEKRGLVNSLKDFLYRHKPFLGICLGLQLLFESSEESPRAKGLGVFKGKVVRFRSPSVKIPHMGWNSIRVKNKHPLLTGLGKNPYYYFVHSYYAKPAKRDLITASCSYGKETFAAAIGNETIFATQFHPEKSQSAGLAILKNFLRW